jgi:hypothetical protein
MNVPLWVSELARIFWEAVGGPEPFPRTLRRPIVHGPFELTVKEMPALRLAGAGRYLGGQGVPWPCRGPDRSLRACLAAAGGAGFILIDADDPPAERVFSLAHELAHFLRHAWQPRAEACRRLGEGVADVIDGRRAATPVERVRALLVDVPLGLHVHLMERDERGRVRSPAVARVGKRPTAWRMSCWRRPRQWRGGRHGCAGKGGGCGSCATCRSSSACRRRRRGTTRTCSCRGGKRIPCYCGCGGRSRSCS